MLVYLKFKESKLETFTKWMQSDEARMTATAMVNTVIETLDQSHDTFEPRPKFDVIKITERPQKYVTHKLTDYSYE